MEQPRNIDVKIIVVLMIKNEEKIIKRCINHLLGIADAICVSDTGSTDDTLEILYNFLPSLSIPTRIVNHAWKNFGHNRSLSFVAAQTFCNSLCWDLNRCYALVVDADMNLVVTDKFVKNSLSYDGYSIIQKGHDNTEYFNARFLKLSCNWKSVGVTHEYWDYTLCEELLTVYIDDIGDGGCKDDKYVRDERLLKEGLVAEPQNSRYMFYLAQTLHNMSKCPEAIEMYKQCISMNGWFEEVWYCMYMLCKMYYCLGDFVEMEYWGLKSYKLSSFRAESMYILTKAFRENSQHYKAWHYMTLGKSIKKPQRALFVELNVYEHLFDYEKTILSYYVEKCDRGCSRVRVLQDLISYYNKYQHNDCYSNIQYYVENIKCNSSKPLNFRDVDGFTASSISFLRYTENSYVANVRFVNYRIAPNGSYILPENIVQTRNYVCFFDNSFNLCGPMRLMSTDQLFITNEDSVIKGVEDVRLYREMGGGGAEIKNDSIKWIGCTSEFSIKKNISQIIGKYDIENCRLINGIPIHSPTSSNCEKNWIPFVINNSFIHSWHPFTIGIIENDEFKTIHVQNTPVFFKNIRGSSNIVEYNDSLYCLTHIVMYSTPRKYYHLMIRINKHTYNIEAYTNPFYFFKNHIEYVLGLDIRDDTFYAIASRNDTDPILVNVSMSTLVFFELCF